MHFRCDVNFDPFVYMHENDKIYGSFLSCHRITHRTLGSIRLKRNSGFTITLYEFRRTIESLWSTVRGMLSPETRHLRLARSRFPLSRRVYLGAPRIRCAKQCDEFPIRQWWCRLQPLPLYVHFPFPESPCRERSGFLSSLLWVK